ncbi:hypothetical protein C8F01DRAFT_1092574 [Mycena amicta]|nr:hypothetical protein C8F01DRAFT_1092574 [Mycena amicta]
MPHCSSPTMNNKFLQHLQSKTLQSTSTPASSTPPHRTFTPVSRYHAHFRSLHCFPSILRRTLPTLTLYAKSSTSTLGSSTAVRSEPCFSSRLTFTKQRSTTLSLYQTTRGHGWGALPSAFFSTTIMLGRLFSHFLKRPADASPDDEPPATRRRVSEASNDVPFQPSTSPTQSHSPEEEQQIVPSDNSEEDLNQSQETENPRELRGKKNGSTGPRDLSVQIKERFGAGREVEKWATPLPFTPQLRTVIGYQYAYRISAYLPPTQAHQMARDEELARVGPGFVCPKVGHGDCGVPYCRRTPKQQLYRGPWLAPTQTPAGSIKVCDYHNPLLDVAVTQDADFDLFMANQIYKEVSVECCVHDCAYEDGKYNSTGIGIYPLCSNCEFRWRTDLAANPGIDFLDFLVKQNHESYAVPAHGPSASTARRKHVARQLAGNDLDLCYLCGSPGDTVLLLPLETIVVFVCHECNRRPRRIARILLGIPRYFALRTDPFLNQTHYIDAPKEFILWTFVRRLFEGHWIRCPTTGNWISPTTGIAYPYNSDIDHLHPEDIEDLSQYFPEMPTRDGDGLISGLAATRGNKILHVVRILFRYQLQLLGSPPTREELKDFWGRLLKVEVTTQFDEISEAVLARYATSDFAREMESVDSSNWSSAKHKEFVTKFYRESPELAAWSLENDTDIDKVLLHHHKTSLKLLWLFPLDDPEIECLDVNRILGTVEAESHATASFLCPSGDREQYVQIHDTRVDDLFDRSYEIAFCGPPKAVKTLLALWLNHPEVEELCDGVARSVAEEETDFEGLLKLHQVFCEDLSIAEALEVQPEHAHHIWTHKDHEYRIGPDSDEVMYGTQPRLVFVPRDDGKHVDFCGQVEDEPSRAEPVADETEEECRERILFEQRDEMPGMHEEEDEDEDDDGAEHEHGAEDEDEYDE